VDSRSCCPIGIRGFSPGMKQSGHSPPPSAKVKKHTYLAQRLQPGHFSKINSFLDKIKFLVFQHPLSVKKYNRSIYTVSKMW
jgi:hypothetical protein